MAAAPSPPTPPRRWTAGYVSLLMLALGIALGLLTAFASTQSHKLGPTLTIVAAGPLAFGIVGTLIALLTRRSRRGAVATMAPIGCGCVSALATVGFALFYFWLVWPKL